MKREILIIEDDRDTVELLALHLRDLNCEVETANDGLTGIAKVTSKPYGLVILDLTLPKADGLEVCRRIRSQSSYTPILILTARAAEVERVLGLEMGADDYVVKPFSMKELMARVNAIFRRVEILQSEGMTTRPIKCGDLFIDIDKHHVSVAGKTVCLTLKEFDLLVQLAKNPGRVYSRSQLLDCVWGYSFAGCSHTVNSHINRLRAKLEDDPHKPRYIQTVWGLGYSFCDG